MARVHDADLCKRIRDLEKEVERLKARPVHCDHWHYWPYYPRPYPHLYWGSTSTGISGSAGTYTIDAGNSSMGSWSNTLSLGSSE
jgi:hypothetical protein